MILIADSGGTKTDWALLHSPYPQYWNVITSFQTQGINPIHQSMDAIGQIIGQEVVSQLSTFSRAALVNSKALEMPLMSQIGVIFYGSGCTPVHIPGIKQMLGQYFRFEGIEVYSDLTAAARALCQHEPGIACILGTGANSCLYDGKDIVQNTPALGYVLGDEGSGAVLGKLLVGDVLKKQLPEHLCQKFLDEYNMDRTKIINAVYRQPAANRFLAQFAPFLERNIDEPAIHDLVLRSFTAFFVRNVESYDGYKQLPCNFVGSIALKEQKVLREAAAARGITIGNIIQNPMEGLVKYHSVNA